MIRKENKQSSFLDTDYLCERLVPKDSFYRRFRELVSPLISDEMFADLYCSDNGRPALAPSMMACACILQRHMDLSDREMEEACMYDIRIKHALGLGIDERAFDHSSLHDFRRRLVDNGREKAVFNKILSHLINEGLIDKNEIQRIDATHIIADIAIPTAIRLIRKTTYEVLKMLKNRRKDVWDEVAGEIDMKGYNKKKINVELPWKPEDRQHKNALNKVVFEAQTVYRHVEALSLGEGFRYRVEMLSEVLNQNVKSCDDGKISLLEGKERPKDPIVSPVDPDARFGAKSHTKKFVGYKANITETIKSRYITNISVTGGNSYDGDETVVLVSGQKRSHDLSPEKMIGDGAYGSGANRHITGAYGVQMVAPIAEKNPAQGVFPKSMFKYDESTNTVTCPMGAESYKTTYNQKRCDTSYYFPSQVCAACIAQDKCTTSEKNWRIISMGPWQKELTEAERFNRTREYKKLMKKRCLIEPTNADMKNNHGMARARYRGKVKVELQCIFTAVVINIKRWINGMIKTKIQKAVYAA